VIESIFWQVPIIMIKVHSSAIWPITSMVLLENFLGERFCLGDNVDVILEKGDLGEEDVDDEVLESLGLEFVGEDAIIGRLDVDDDIIFLGNSALNLHPK
jgi:hypothetical protein